MSGTGSDRFQESIGFAEGLPIRVVQIRGRVPRKRRQIGPNASRIDPGLVLLSRLVHRLMLVAKDAHHHEIVVHVLPTADAINDVSALVMI